MTNKEVIILDLSKSETGTISSTDSLLQKTAQKKLYELIELQLNNIPDDNEARHAGVPSRSAEKLLLSYPRRHGAILIEGGRGSGKTTFLLNALDAINKTAGDFETTKKRVKVLPMIDPTLIETKQHIIVVILSLIETEIEKCNDERGQLDEARQDLAEGLALLDGIGNAAAYGAEWEDASWVMSRGLEKARKGHSFERKLNLYLARALALLNVDAFVLSFDDIDTNFTHGFTILETIRKYLTSPRLILILSGDLELYGRLLRQNIYRTFGQQVLEADINILGRDKSDLKNAVLELEEQYLLKIVPPQNRISMLSIGGVMQWYQIKLGKAGQMEDTALPEHLEYWASSRINNQLLEEPQSKTIHPFFTQVAKEHMRMVIGYLRALQQEPERTSRQAVLTVFEARLRAYGLPPDLIQQGTFDYTLRVAFEWLVKQDDAPELIQFGIPADRNKAVVLHCLAVALGHFLPETSGTPLRALFALNLPLAMMHRPAFSDRTRRMTIANFLWVHSSPSTPELAARIGAIDRHGHEIGKANASSFGAVGIVNKAPRDELVRRIYGPKQQKSVSITVASLHESSKWNTRWLDALLEKNLGTSDFAHGLTWFNIDELLSEDRIGKLSSYLSLAVYRRFTPRGEVNRAVSALSIFAVMAEMLVGPYRENLSSYTITTIIPALHFESGQAGKFEILRDDDSFIDNEEVDDDETSNVDDDSFKQFQSHMAAWREFASTLKEKVALPPAVIGQIAQRMHDDLIALDGKVLSTWKTGEILHRQITNILHCVIAVTSDHVGRKESPKTSDRPLIELLGKDVLLHPFSAILLSCPLIWAFLDPAESGQTSHAVRLRKAAAEALKKAYPDIQQDISNQENLKDSAASVSRFAQWMIAPKIAVSVTGKAPKDPKSNKLSVEVHGFFDLLNLVPRHA